MILVTGAAGKTGRAVIQAMVARGQTVRALVHRQEQVPQVEALGAREAITGDMRDPAVLAQAARGVRAVYHICPNVNPDEVAIGRAAVAAAVAVGVEHFVHHSVLHPQTSAMPHHWQKLQVEEILFESRLRFTILQPASYMQNILAGWRTIVEDGVHAVPYPVTTRLGMVDLNDVAEAAAVVATEFDHAGATYELAGAEVLDQIAVAEIMGRVLARPVRAEQVPIEAWRARARARGLGDDQVTMLEKMFDYYARFDFWGNPRVLAWLLGRSPTTVEAFARRVASVADAAGA